MSQTSETLDSIKNLKTYTHFYHKEIYNEKWLLRIIVSWILEKDISAKNNIFSLENDIYNWENEIILRSHFPKRTKKDLLTLKRKFKIRNFKDSYEENIIVNLVIGKFKINSDNEFILNENSNQFIFIDSALNTSNYFNKIKEEKTNRIFNVLTSIFEKLFLSEKKYNYQNLSYFMIVPKKWNYHYTADWNKAARKKEINLLYKNRIIEYYGEHKEEQEILFEKFLYKIKIKKLYWEDVVDYIKYKDIESGELIEKFYSECINKVPRLSAYENEN